MIRRDTYHVLSSSHTRATHYISEGVCDNDQIPWPLLSVEIEFN